MQDFLEENMETKNSPRLLAPKVLFGHLGKRENSSYSANEHIGKVEQSSKSALGHLR